MTAETELIYREQQRFPLWLRWLIALSIVLAIVLAILSLPEAFSGRGLDGIRGAVPALIIGICLPIAIAVLFSLLKLETQVRPDGLYVRFFPFHINFKRFPAEDLGEYYARQYKPILEYGGWGIRYSLKNGKAYNVSGNKGVQLVFKNGKKLLIGSQRPDELEQAIRAIIKNN